MNCGYFRWSLVLAAVAFIFTLQAVIPAAVSAASGTYQGQNWTISEAHILLWEGKPYIPYGVRGPKAFRDITKTFAEVDFFLQHGIKEFVLSHEGDLENEAGWSQTQVDDWFDKTTSYISQKGGTYLLVLEFAFPWKKKQGFGGGNRPVDLADRNFEAFVAEQCQRFKRTSAKSGLRVVVFSDEINHHYRFRSEISPEAYGHILERYASLIKSIFGQVPVIYRVDGNLTSLPVLAGLQEKSTNGVTVEFHGYDTEDIKQIMTRLDYLGKINRMPEPKFLWADINLFWDAKEYPPFASKQELANCFLAGAAQGVTGFWSDLDYITTPGRRSANFSWYAEVKPGVIDAVLGYQRARTFVRTGAGGGLALHYKVPKQSPEKIRSLVQAEIEAAGLTGGVRDIAVSAPSFDSSDGTWAVELMRGRMEMGSILVDDATGKVVRNTVALRQKVKPRLPGRGD